MQGLDIPGHPWYCQEFAERDPNTDQMQGNSGFIPKGLNAEKIKNPKSLKTPTKESNTGRVTCVKILKHGRKRTH